MYTIVKNYRHDEALRASFNGLAEATFGLNFENWYRLGYWGEDYIPYSVVMDGEVVANVSLNRTDLLIEGQRKRLYQLGTVMTREDCRNRGLIRAIMAEIEKDTADADGIYLFANDSVVDFYPKFGFTPSREIAYRKEVSQTGSMLMMSVPMDNANDRGRLGRAMEQSRFRDGCHMVDNPGLIFFYAAQFMQDNVYYCEGLDAWAIAELEDGELLLHSVFAEENVTLARIIAAFGGKVRRVELGFTPHDPAGFEKQEISQEDCHFFVKGEFFGDFEAKNLRIPALSHA